MNQKVFIKNKKGLKLAGILHYPDQLKKYPAVILLHGFTGYKEEEHIAMLAKDLEKNGFVAIRFDCSGFGESEGEPENDYKMSNYIVDVRSVYEYLKQLSFIDDKRVGVWGHSMGGMIAIIFAAKYPELKAACVVSAPNYISNSLWFLTLINEWEHRGIFKFERFDKKRTKISYDFVVDSQKYKITDYVERVNQPILFIVGKKDISVDPSDTKKIFLHANKPKFWVEFPEMDHDYKLHPKLIKKVNEKVTPFFKKYL